MYIDGVLWFEILVCFSFPFSHFQGGEQCHSYFKIVYSVHLESVLLLYIIFIFYFIFILYYYIYITLYILNIFHILNVL